MSNAEIQRALELIQVNVLWLTREICGAVTRSDRARIEELGARLAVEKRALIRLLEASRS